MTDANVALNKSYKHVLFTIQVSVLQENTLKVVDIEITDSRF